MKLLHLDTFISHISKYSLQLCNILKPDKSMRSTEGHLFHAVCIYLSCFLWSRALSMFLFISRCMQNVIFVCIKILNSFSANGKAMKPKKLKANREKLRFSYEHTLEEKLRLIMYTVLYLPFWKSVNIRNFSSNALCSCSQ